MPKYIVINSVNYDGEEANILFKPDDDNVVVNLGNVVLPYTFYPENLVPERDVYGTYTILVLGADCPNFMNVTRPTPTPRPTTTPTRTITPTTTPTTTPTPTFDPCKVPSQTPTPTQTITPTRTPRPTVTPTPTFNPCITPFPTNTPTPSITPTISVTPSITPTNTPTISVTPTITPTSTVTPTVTPTLTPTTTPTPSVTIGLTPTQTPTNTKTPTPTPTPVYLAYLFIEPSTGSTNIGQWMYDGGSNFFGFTNNSQPTQNQVTFNTDMNRYVDFSGWTSGLFPSLISQTVPQSSGGFDSFGNSIVQYNFLTTGVPQNTIPVQAWYTWIIPVLTTNNERQTDIDLNTLGNPNMFTAVATEGTINSYTFTYTGSTITPTTYRVYTTYPNTIFKLNNTETIYFRGNAVSP